MSKLLIDEYPLIVLPTLAAKIGLNEAIFLQQLNYWLAGSQHEIDGKKWVYNTFEEWQKQLHFWPVVTIKRIVKSLREMGIVSTTSQYNKMPMDRTLWYTIDYAKLDSILEAAPKYQNDTMEVSDRYDGEYQNDTSNNQRLPKNTTEREAACDAPHSENLNVASTAIEQKPLSLPVSMRPVFANGTSSKPAHHARVTSDKVDPRKLHGGRIAAGTGKTAIEVFYERHSASDSETRLSAPLEDDIMGKVKDLEKWRGVVIAWQQAGYKPKNIKGQLQWYEQGIPDSYKDKSAPAAKPLVADVPDYILKMQQGIGK